MSQSGKPALRKNGREANDDQSYWPRPWTLDALDGQFNRLAEEVCAILLSKEIEESSSPTHLSEIDKDHYPERWQYWQRLSDIAGISDARMLLRLIVQYERTLRFDEDWWGEPCTNTRYQMHSAVVLATQIGLLTQRVFGDEASEALTGFATTGGRASGKARQWWWPPALNRAQEHRRLHAEKSDADLARVIKREMEKAYPLRVPTTEAGETTQRQEGKMLPRTEAGYYKAVLSWVKSGKLNPRR